MAIQFGFYTVYEKAKMLLYAKQKTKFVAVKIDEKDAEKVCALTWYVTERGYIRSSTGTPRVLLHRFVMGAPSGFVVDHKNGDKLDNRRDNLRIASHAENMRNRKLSKLGTKGVTWRPRDGKWEASIKVDKKSIFLGSYLSKVDAMLAYDAAARNYHGEFARTNLPGTEKATAESLIGKTPIRSASGFIGVTKDARANSWRAEVKGPDGLLWRASFSTAEDAAKARDAKAIEIQGKRAKLNFREDLDQ